MAIIGATRFAYAILLLIPHAMRFYFRTPAYF